MCTADETVPVEVDANELSLKKSRLMKLIGTLGQALTNREELSFLTVLALPKASKMGLA